ncbi:unnamed protein product [Durusdinium trenchii]|uniref:Uncharacterized protein n=2 Tax=Durusdinium trenchii TaxID=1381693 RepID=A0ABP0HYM8_9DINO
MARWCTLQSIVVFILCDQESQVTAARVTGGEADEAKELNASRSHMAQFNHSRKLQSWREVAAWSPGHNRESAMSQTFRPAHEWFSWKQERFLAVLTVLSFFTLAITYLIASGIQMMIQARRVRQVLKNQLTHQNQALSVQAVLEARLEIFRSLVELSHDRESNDSDFEVKVLVAFFKEVMERIWDAMKSGMLDDEVQIVLETALESNEECTCISERKQLCLDLVASTMQHATPEAKGKLLTLLERGLQQQIRSLVQEGFMPRKALLDAAAAKETDGMLEQRLKFLLAEEASCAAAGCSGFFGFGVR